MQHNYFLKAGQGSWSKRSLPTCNLCVWPSDTESIIIIAETDQYTCGATSLHYLHLSFPPFSRFVAKLYFDRLIVYLFYLRVYDVDVDIDLMK